MKRLSRKLTDLREENTENEPDPPRDLSSAASIAASGATATATAGSKEETAASLQEGSQQQQQSSPPALEAEAAVVSPAAATTGPATRFATRYSRIRSGIRAPAPTSVPEDSKDSNSQVSGEPPTIGAKVGLRGGRGKRGPWGRNMPSVVGRQRPKITELLLAASTKIESSNHNDAVLSGLEEAKQRGVIGILDYILKKWKKAGLATAVHSWRLNLIGEIEEFCLIAEDNDNWNNSLKDRNAALHQAAEEFLTTIPRLETKQERGEREHREEQERALAVDKREQGRVSKLKEETDAEFERIETIKSEKRKAVELHLFSRDVSPSPMRGSHSSLIAPKNLPPVQEEPHAKPFSPKARKGELTKGGELGPPPPITLAEREERRKAAQAAKEARRVALQGEIEDTQFEAKGLHRKLHNAQRAMLELTPNDRGNRIEEGDALEEDAKACCVTLFNAV